MGATYVEATVRSGDREERVRFLVDSGVTYSLLPHTVWTSLGLRAERTVDTILADGSVIGRDVAECYFILPEGRAHSPVFLGERGDTALLGVVTLENLGLVLNPFTRTLHPMRMLLA